MTNKVKFKLLALYALMLFSSISSFADTMNAEDTPAIDPPPAAPIDAYLLPLVFFGVVLAGYFFYKKNKIASSAEQS